MSTGFLSSICMAGLLLGVSPSLHAQESNLVAGVKTLTCTFSLSVVATWAEGEPKVTPRTGGTLTVKIVDIDTGDGSARIEGKDERPVAQLSGWNLHILDMQAAGALNITTVFSQESKPGPTPGTGKLKAVQTRTDYLPVTLPRYVSSPTVSQYYGECEATR